MTPEARKRLQEKAWEYTSNVDQSAAYQAGAQAAWEMREAEITGLRKALRATDTYCEKLKAERERIFTELRNRGFSDYDSFQILYPKGTK